MKALTVSAVTMALAMSAAPAAAKIKFVGMDETQTTRLCVTAADQGLNAALKLADSLGIKHLDAKYTVCNGEKLVHFAGKYQQGSARTEPIYKVIAKNDNTASQICADAVSHSLEYAEEKYGDISNVICNGRKIAYFVKRYQG